jgi:hypothetical protein
MNTPYFMYPAAASALRTRIMRRTAALREARDMRGELVRCGWSRKAAAELVAIHVRMAAEAVRG